MAMMSSSGYSSSNPGYSGTIGGSNGYYNGMQSIPGPQPMQSTPGSVLGASTNQAYNAQTGTTRSTTPTQVSQPQQNNNNNANIPIPPMQDFQSYYNSTIDPLIQAAQGAGQGVQSAYDASNAQIDANVGQQTGMANNQANAAYAAANTQQTGLNQNAQQNTDLQRQGAADSVRGLQAQFGGSTGTGAYLGEQAYRGGLQNISQIHQGLMQATSQINNQIDQVRNTTASTLQNIQAQADAQKLASKNQFDQAMQQIRNQVGTLQSTKAQLTGQAIQQYQAQVQAINAQNAQFQQNLQLEAQRAQDILNLYGQKVSTAVQTLQKTSIPNPSQLGGSQSGSFNKTTGQYFNAQGQQVDSQGNVIGGSAGGGQLDPNQLYSATQFVNSPLPQTQQPQSSQGINSIDPSVQQRLSGLGL